MEKTHKRKALNKDNVEVEGKYTKLQCDSMDAGPKKTKDAATLFGLRIS